MPDNILLSLSQDTALPAAWGPALDPANTAKRAADLLLGLSLLVLCTPLLLLIAISIRLSGPGPAIFRQTRIGAGGKTFAVLKFRTMHQPAAAPFHQATSNDPRVTRIGRLLRRNSLDELLQLINVIKGEMSLVGPRPHAPETTVEGKIFEDAVMRYRLRHNVKPGMTGLAQIRGQRGETRTLAALEQRVASDLQYIESWSLGLDFVILLKTVPAVLSQRNAF